MEFVAENTFFGSLGAEVIDGTQTADLVLGLQGSDKIYGGLGGDYMYGNQGSDLIHGNQGSDTVFGGQNNDTVRGGKDNDLLFGDKGDDTLYGDLGNDTVLGMQGNDLVFGNGGSDLLNGNQGNDTVDGGEGNDTLQGGKDNDSLFGAGGDDIIYGDLGIDTLTGGAGSDTFVIGQGTGADGDFIADYTDGEDVLEFANGLTLAQVNILQGTGENASNTILENRDSGEILAILQGVDSSIFAAAGFEVQNDDELLFQIPEITGSGITAPIFPSARISPTNGKEMVNLTQETIVRFRDRIDPNTINQESFYLIANGERVPGRIDVSSTEQFATFYYDEPLPASTEVRVVVDGDKIAGADGGALDVDEDGNPGGMLTSDFRTLPLTQIEGTDVFGYVFDSFNKNPDGSDRPVVGATISLDALPNVTAVTDENGFFTLENVPAPEFFVHIDGSTATNAPEGNVYATVGKPFHSVPGQSVQLEKNGEPFDIYLPPMAEADLQELSPTEDTEVGFGEAGKAQLAELLPDIDPSVWDEISVTFPANSARDDSGTPATQATIIPVAPDRLPAPLPGELDPQLVISIQAEGATSFDVPAPITFPNLEGLAPGQKSLIFSFNHDAGEWEVIGRGTVSQDGRSIVSDEGVGILAPGWHFVQPGAIVNGSIGTVDTDRIFLAFENQDNGFITRITSNSESDFSQVLSPYTSYKIYAYDPTSNLTSVIDFTTGNSGTVLDLPSIVPSDPLADDMDGEGLADIAEVAVGTSETNSDTDDDGINDFTEIQEGLDPLGGRAFPTGIIASLPLQGEAKAVVVEGSNISDIEQIAYLATGSHGLAIVDTSQFDNPTVLGQLDLPGDATDVAIDPNLELAVVATNNGGLQLVDISDPMEPKVTNNLNLSANQVEVANGIAYATSDNELHAIDLLTGETLQELELPGSGTVTGVAREGTKLYTFASGSNTLSVVDVEGAANVMGQLDNVPISNIVSVFAANGVVYLGGAGFAIPNGITTIDVSDPSAPTLISDPDFNFDVRGLALNGSGLALAGSEISGVGVGIYDITDPQNTNNFLFQIAAPGEALSIAIASGIAFVADGSSGLQVINYLPFDNQGQAPTVEIGSSVADRAPDTPGIQIIEGSTIIPITAEVTDDVQVSNLELLFNGQVVGNDVSFPFEFSTLAPYIGDGPNTLTAQVRATDTGGNSSLSNELTFELSEDVFPPVVNRTIPTDGKLFFNELPISIFLSEKIDASLIDLSGISLTYLGADETLGGGDDETIALESVQTPSEERISIVPENPLPIGNHQLVIQPSIIADLAGNALESPFTLDFSTFDVPEDAVAWISESDGNWNDPSNWSTGTVPGADDEVIIDFPGAEPTITISSDVAVRDLRSEEPILITGGNDSLPGYNLTVNEQAELNSDFRIENGGSLTVIGADTSLVANSSVELENASLIAKKGGTISLPKATNYTLANARIHSNSLQADGADSLIDLPGLKTINSSDSDSFFMSIRSSNGGRINLSAVTEIAKENEFSYGHIALSVDGADSNIDLTALTSVTGTSFSASNGATLAAPALTELTGQVNYNQSFQADGAGSILDFPVLKTISKHQQFSSSDMLISASNGGSVNLSAVTEISHEEKAIRGYIVLSVDGAESNIDLAALTSVTGTSLTASNGATLAAPVLKSYIHKATYNSQGLRAEGADSLLDLPALETITSTDEDFYYYNSYLYVAASNGGHINLNEVTKISQEEGSENGNISLYVDGVDSNIKLAALTSVTGVSFSAYNGATLAAPALTNYNYKQSYNSSYYNTYNSYYYGKGLLANGVGSILELPVLETITSTDASTDTSTDTTEQESLSLSVQASDGGSVNLDKTNAIIILPDSSDTEVTFGANGTDSIINALDLLSSAAAFTATAGGTIVLKDKTIEA